MTKDILDKINEDTFVISDTHIGHGNQNKGILLFEPCRLSAMITAGYEAHEHDKWVIDNWNSTVSPDDVVLHLGDFAFKHVASSIEQLNGDIIMILGNHDGKGYEQKYNGVETVKGFYYEDELKYLNKVHNPITNDRMLSALIKEIQGEKILFSHYALFDNEEFDRKNTKIAPRIDVLEKLYGAHNCSKNLHGHIHSNKSAFKDSVNCSMENLDFRPRRLRELLSKNV